MTLARKLDDGLDLFRVTCPVGVILVIFEARPEVVIQISCLAIKSGTYYHFQMQWPRRHTWSHVIGNAVLLKGGKEAKHTNAILIELVRDALQRADLPIDAVQLVSTRDEISGLLRQEKYVDLVIPRGSNQVRS